MNAANRRLSDADLQRLLGFRDGLRRFLRWSEQQARSVGLTGPQHQLLLAVRGHGAPPSIGEVADHLLSRHHSVVELVDRAERAGLLARDVDHEDHRVVRLNVTPLGEEKLLALSAAHLEELSRLRPSFESLWSELPRPAQHGLSS
jgi:DNA-binding MarR family transcriptional regulator